MLNKDQILDDIRKWLPI